MNKYFLLFLLLFVAGGLSAQMTLFNENFGTSAYFKGKANAYSGYSTNKANFSADSILIQNYDGSLDKYTGASGGSRLDLKLVPNPTPASNPNRYVITISNINTSGYSQCRLSYGIGCWSGTPSAYIDVHYSTDGTNWTQIDDATLNDGSYVASPGGAMTWSWVKLEQVLPSATNLRLRFTNTDAVQGVFLDDIVVSGYSNDQNPPSKPVGLVAGNLTFNSFILRWDPSTDDVGMAGYDVYRDGVKVTTVTSPGVSFKYQASNTTSDFTVIAKDVSGNSSTESDPLEVTTPAMPVDYQFSWEKPHSTVLPAGDLEWAPEPFVYEHGASVRYIDYDGGNDSYDGLTPGTAWKRHPWDASSTGNAKNCTGIHTYVFKRGVVYRGTLTAKESGEPGNPIRLTSDPSWGTGEACIYGSTKYTTGWTRADATSAPNVPDPTNVWYRDIAGMTDTKSIVEYDGSNYHLIRVARTPNYVENKQEPMKNWWRWTGKGPSGSKFYMQDTKNLTQENVDYYKGGTVRSSEDVVVMCTVWEQVIQDYIPASKQIIVNDGNFGGNKCPYFIENTRFLLDTADEFYYDNVADRLFLRLRGDKDPNTTTIEVATKDKLLKMDNKHDIVVSGLSFGMTTKTGVRFGDDGLTATIEMLNTCYNIEIKNCNFRFVNGGILCKTTTSAATTARDITISDNDFYVVHDQTISMSQNGGNYLEDIYVLRNRIYDNGARHLGRWYSSIPAIRADLISGEIAGNIIDVSWGNGVDCFWGKGGSDSRSVPFVRGIVHHNKATNTLLGTNDYGGIEGWQGGPSYYYSNISHHASGYKYHTNNSLGYNFYIDGGFKQYLFNNIASGISWNHSGAGYQQVLGFFNMYVNNTGYRLNDFAHSGDGNLSLDGHNLYAANIADSCGTTFPHYPETQHVPFDSYGNNVFSQTPFSGCYKTGLGPTNYKNFIKGFSEFKPQWAHLGWEAYKPVLVDPASGDFRPKTDGEAIDRGIKFFAAFPLKAVVGEWNFYKHPADSSIIMADNLYFTNEYSERTSYHAIPKNHLKAYNVTLGSFVDGVLEDWTQGALTLNGTSTYCSITHSVASTKVCNNVDMTTNNFILEMYLKTAENHTNGTLMAKYGTSGYGYQLNLDGSGKVCMNIMNAGAVHCKRTVLQLSTTGSGITCWQR